MSRKEECVSVDLTEDEASCVDKTSHKNTPLNFVDCAKAASSMMSPTVTNRNRQETQNVSSGKPEHRAVNVPNVNITANSNHNVVENRRNSIGKFHSVQIRPPITMTSEKSKVVNSTRLETVCLDSDEDEPNRLLSQQQTVSNLNEPVHPPKQTGKVVVLKKNNKLYKIVIPHNVMPNVNKTVGPVLINIPEVGPLVITMDPRVTNAAKMQPTKQTKQIVNLDNLPESQNIEHSLEKERVLKQNEKEAMLCDKKFCWTYLRGRKRDLDGFTFNDRLGFNRSESNRVRKCWKTLDVIVSKKRRELIRLIHTYNRFRNNRNHTIKLVKINEIVGKTPKKPGRKRKSRSTVSVQVEEPDPPPPSVSEDVTSYYDSDLLLTKKVVFLKENEEGNHVETKQYPVKSPRITKKLSKREKARRFRERIKKSKTTKHKNLEETDCYKAFKLKPCYVEMVREKYVEEACMKQFKKLPSDAENQNKTTDHKKNNLNQKKNNKQKMKFVRSFRKKNIDVRRKIIRKENIKTESNSCAKIQPVTCLTELEMLNYTFQNITKIFLSKVIVSEERFVREMNLLKPILVVHEYNVRTINYSDEFSKNNIVFVVQESLRFPDCILSNQHFVSAVELGYLKLVASKLFCKFVSGTMNVLDAKKHIRDHNYCLNKK